MATNSISTYMFLNLQKFILILIEYLLDAYLYHKTSKWDSNPGDFPIQFLRRRSGIK